LPSVRNGHQVGGAAVRFVFNANVYGWRMTGLIGKGGQWFLGFSRQPAHVHADECWEPDSGCDMGRNEKYARVAGNWLTDPAGWDFCDRHEESFPMAERCPKCTADTSSPERAP
jgi:hypothetical protein